jgi:hypothetical protein
MQADLRARRMRRWLRGKFPFGRTFIYFSGPVACRLILSEPVVETLERDQKIIIVNRCSTFSGCMFPPQ